jgi:hypothetical protein
MHVIGTVLHTSGTIEHTQGPQCPITKFSEQFSYLVVSYLPAQTAWFLPPQEIAWVALTNSTHHVYLSPKPINTPNPPCLTSIVIRHDGTTKED